MARAMFWQDAKYCFRKIFQISRYSEYSIIQTLATHLGVVWFVVSVWRRRDLAIILGGAVAGTVAFLYGQIYLTPSDATHHITRVMTWGGLGTALVLTLIRVLSLHKSRVYGTDQTQRHTLSPRFFMESPPDGSDPGHPTIWDIVGVETDDTDDTDNIHIDPNVEILTVGCVDRSMNRAAVDLRVANALLKTQTITIKEAKDRSLFHGNRHDIMALTAETAKSVQTDALQIMRREALRSRISFFDSPKIALKELCVESDEKLSCKVGRSSYFVTCLTNDLSTQCLALPDGKMITSLPIEELFPAILRAEDAPPAGVAADCVAPTRFTSPRHAYALRRLEGCQHLSNHVGSVVLAVSSDGMPILCFQGQAARINPGKVVLSGAGSIDMDDLHNSRCGNDLALAIRYGMARELLEETGAVPQDSNRPCDRERLRAYAPRIRLAGYYRDLCRGGLPIFIGFCRMNTNFNTIKSRQHDRPCLFQSPAETRVVSGLPEGVIANASDMLSYFENHVRSTATFRCVPSDQLLLIREMLRLPVIQKHFNEAIG